MSSLNHSRGAGDLAPGERALLEFLEQQEEPGALDFEAFCAARPAIADELRARYAEWRKVGGLVAEQGRKFDGTHEDGGSVIALEAFDATGATLADVLKRLAEPGRRAGRYTTRVELTRGGMGAIVKVFDAELRRHSVMKVALSRTRDGAPDPARAEDRIVIARFLEEAQITGQLEHPGIAPVHELGVDEEARVYFTMPFIRGRDLKEIITLAREGREDWNQTRALGVLLKICEAVGYAHSRRVVHRDLKPGNVRVGRFGETYVMDWGLARVLDRPDTRDLRLAADPEQSLSGVRTDRRDALSHTPDSPLLTMDGQVVGTPSYMAPEQARGQIERVGPRSDVYSIGAMLYQLLCGEAPYVPAGARISAHTVLAALLHSAPRPVRDIDASAPEELVAICDKAMAREPEQRYATSLELARDIEAYLGNRPVEAHAPSLGHVLVLACKRNRKAVWTAAFAAVALLVVGAIAGWRELAAQRAERELAAANRRADELIYARALPAQAAELHPALPRTAPAMEAWLANVERLLAARASWDADASGEREFMRAAFAELDQLRPAVEARLALARRLADPEEFGRAAAWSAAKSSIAAQPMYQGLRVAEVEGLVPLGLNASTGLWEFWNVLSGERPQWSADLGASAPRETDGVVLVLLPAATFVMGSPPEDDLREPSGEDQRDVDVPALYAGKFEVTQAQWRRVMGTDPSLFRAGAQFTAVTGRQFTPSDLHPVESIDWFHADEFARRIGLGLMSEEAWEFACRGGTTTRWIWGDEQDELAGKLNLSDLTGELEAGLTRMPSRAPVTWRDGHALTSPVGSFEPNPFGLYDCDGNVSEWTASWRQDDWLAPDEPRRRVVRGGNWMQTPKIARSAQPQFDLPTGANFARGLRVGWVAPVER